MTVDLLDILKDKLDNVGVKYELYFNPEDNSPDFIEIKIPIKNEDITCVYSCDDEVIDMLCTSDFEKYKFIEGYEAIWSPELKSIECEITGMGIGSSIAVERLKNFLAIGGNISSKKERDEEEETNKSIDFMFTEEIAISIGNASTEFLLLESGKGVMPSGYYFRNKKGLQTIRISNIMSKTSDTSVELLQKIANSVFFQIDMMVEIPLFLLPERENRFMRAKRIMRKTRKVRKELKGLEIELAKQKYDYDNESMSLYWYAKSIPNMPLFQFLAYYQTIEYYFPLYSALATKQKIQNLIKNPKFNPNRDKDILDIIYKVRQSATGKSFGNEEDQLRSTINACLDNDELRSFFNEDEARKNHYIDNNGKGLSSHKIPLKDEKADLINFVVKRIYDIRCKIVHTKSNEYDYEILNPFSTNVKMVHYDIELIEFISRKLLISTSKPLNL